jgi:glycosyltransferase involved in cell wall biosynthesis
VTYNWGAIEWAIANRPRIAPHLHVEDGFGPEEADRQLRRRVWARRLLLRGSLVVLPSRTLLRIAAETWRLDPSRLRHVPNGIDCDRFAARPAETPRLPWSAVEPVIGTVAGLRREKNLKRLLHATAQAARTVPCRLVVVGDGPERPALEAIAGELGIADRVLFAGYASDPRVWYAVFDVFALSSDTEQMPYAVMEAMADGLPVAATAVGDVPFMVSKPNRAFLAPCDEEPLGNALRRLVESPELRAVIGEANRRKARREFDERIMFAAYESLFRGEPTPS